MKLVLIKQWIDFYNSKESSSHIVKVEIPGITNSTNSSNSNNLISSTTDGKLLINLGERNFFEEIEPGSFKFNHYSLDKLTGILVLNPSRKQIR